MKDTNGGGGYIAVALFGLCLIAGGFGIVIGRDYHISDAHPVYMDTEDGKRSSPIVKRPCEAMNSLNEADLCAQYKAASAAQFSAFWSMIQAITGVFAVIGLIVTLLYNRTALAIAQAAQDSSQDLGQRQVRAYVTFKPDVFISIREGGFITVDYTVFNSGQTPARRLHAEIKADVIILHPTRKQVITFVPHDGAKTSVSAQESIMMRQVVFKDPIEQDLLDNIIKATSVVLISVRIKVFYKDVFGKDCHTYQTFGDIRRWKLDDRVKVEKFRDVRSKVMAAMNKRKYSRSAKLPN